MEINKSTWLSDGIRKARPRIIKESRKDIATLNFVPGRTSKIGLLEATEMNFNMVAFEVSYNFMYSSACEVIDKCDNIDIKIILQYLKENNKRKSFTDTQIIIKTLNLNSLFLMISSILAALQLKQSLKRESEIFLCRAVQCLADEILWHMKEDSDYLHGYHKYIKALNEYMIENYLLSKKKKLPISRVDAINDIDCLTNYRFLSITNMVLDCIVQKDWEDIDEFELVEDILAELVSIHKQNKNYTHTEVTDVDPSFNKMCEEENRGKSDIGMFLVEPLQSSESFFSKLKTASKEAANTSLEDVFKKLRQDGKKIIESKDPMESLSLICKRERDFVNQFTLVEFKKKIEIRQKEEDLKKTFHLMQFQDDEKIGIAYEANQYQSSSPRAKIESVGNREDQEAEDMFEDCMKFWQLMISDGDEVPIYIENDSFSPDEKRKRDDDTSSASKSSRKNDSTTGLTPPLADMHLAAPSTSNESQTSGYGSSSPSHMDQDGVVVAAPSTSNESQTSGYGSSSPSHMDQDGVVVAAPSTSNKNQDTSGSLKRKMLYQENEFSTDVNDAIPIKKRSKSVSAPVNLPESDRFPRPSSADQIMSVTPIDQLSPFLP